MSAIYPKISRRCQNVKPSPWWKRLFTRKKFSQCANAADRVAVLTLTGHAVSLCDECHYDLVMDGIPMLSSPVALFLKDDGSYRDNRDFTGL